MPIRFQVDPDFYDHPKAIGMSDAATALWVRAGSYSAAKTSDGFVADAALSLLSRTPEDAAGELVTRGLWRRVKGGYRFHQWSLRNLTRARVEADKEADRKRKRRERAPETPPVDNFRPSPKRAGQNEKGQVEPQIVQPESEPDSDRNPTGFHPLSVSVSRSMSVSGSVSGAPPGPPGPEPPPRCPKHLDTADPPRCGPCGDARRNHEAWELGRVTTTAAQQSAGARRRADTLKTAIAACRLCDSTGYVNGYLCTHDPRQTTRATQGVAAARAAVAKKPTTEPETPDA